VGTEATFAACIEQLALLLLDVFHGVNVLAQVFVWTGDEVNPFAGHELGVAGGTPRRTRPGGGLGRLEDKTLVVLKPLGEGLVVAKEVGLPNLYWRKTWMSPASRRSARSEKVEAASPRRYASRVSAT